MCWGLDLRSILAIVYSNEIFRSTSLCPLFIIRLQGQNALIPLSFAHLLKAFCSTFYIIVDPSISHFAALYPLHLQRDNRQRKPLRTRCHKWDFALPDERSHSLIWWPLDSRTIWTASASTTTYPCGLDGKVDPDTGIKTFFQTDPLIERKKR